MKLHIEKMVYGGSGLAHQTDGAESGKAFFVPFTLTDEVVEAEIAAEKAGYGDASLLRVIQPSPVRVAPGCVHFGQCGGCQMQHAEYSAQVQIKAEILRETLQRAGLDSLPEVEVHASEPWGYRNRIRLRVESLSGAIRLGYNRRGGNDFLPVRECPIAAPLLWRAATTLVQLAEADAAIERWLRAATEVELFCNSDESKLQMTLFVRKPLSAGFDDFCGRLKAAIPELCGAGVALLANEAAQRRRRTERPAAGASWGAGGLHYSAAGVQYWVSRGGFFQVNKGLVDEMVRVVTGGRSGRLAWDLYAGVGLFSRALSRSFAGVIGVEGGETAAADLGQTMKGEGTHAVHAATLDFLRAAVVQRERPDLVVMDPPRAGVGTEVCALLVRLKAAEMVYVSCDPVTLSRDLKAMVDSGYALVELHMMDMFPQTFHIETVAVLQRQ